jgi:methyl-accepting chemotaxis protein
LQFEVLELAKGGQVSEAIAFLSPRETPAWRAVRALLLDQVKQSEKQAELKRIELVSVLNASITSAIAVSGLVLVLVVLFTIFVGRGVFRQVGAEPEFTATALSRIAGGDLTHEIELGSADPKSILAAAHAMQTHLRELINKIVLSSEAVLKTSDSLRSNSTNISLRTEEQSSATSAIAAAVEQLTLSLDAEEKVREGLNGVTATTGTISRVANSMIQSSAMMDELSSKVDGINGIARTIRDIADQTNLLALNAAIEAARAGEQGRGFAVVADEVRKLAERTTASTLEISTMITGVQNSTKVAQENLSLTQRLALEGAQYTEEVQSSVLGLNQATSSVRDAVDSIKLALQEQSAASTDIAQRIEQIAQDTEEVHLSTANSSERAQELVELAHMLREQVSRFRTA